MSDIGDLFAEQVRSQLSGQESPAEIERLVLAAGQSVGLAGEQVSAIAKRLCEEAELLKSAKRASPSQPRLLVDWINELRIGTRAFPEFHLICPTGLESQPTVTISIDRSLDHEPDVLQPTLECHDEPGYWTFRVPFQLTTGGERCLPGIYKLEVRVEFSPTTDRRRSVFRSYIYLNVHQPDASDSQTLEIEGDGKALLNLHGDLKRFAKVVIKANDDAVLNWQDLFEMGEKDPELAGTDGPSLKHEYELRLERRIPAREKRVFGGIDFDRPPLSKLCLTIPDGGGNRNVCLLTERQVSIGRKRDNDIVLRLWPRNSQNDHLTSLISSRHAHLAFTESGVVWKNLNCGNGTRIAGAHTQAGSDCLLQQASQIWPADALSLGCELFRVDPTDSDSAYELFEKRLVGISSAPPVGSFRAVRLTRNDSLRGKEEYVVFQRAVSIGSGPSCAIRIDHPTVRPIHGHIMLLGASLWLEAASKRYPTRVDGEAVSLGQLVPLYPNLTVQVGEVELQVTSFHQIHLDVSSA